MVNEASSECNLNTIFLQSFFADDGYNKGRLKPFWHRWRPTQEWILKKIADMLVTTWEILFVTAWWRKSYFH